MWRGQALLALVVISLAQEIGPCPAIPVVSLSARPYSEPLSASAPSVSILLSGSIEQASSCFLTGASVQGSDSAGAGFKAPVMSAGGKFSEVVTIPLPPPASRRAPTVLLIYAAAANQAGTAYSAPVELILPRRP